MVRFGSFLKPNVAFRPAVDDYSIDGRINLALDSKFVEILSSCVPAESEDYGPENDAADFSSSLPSWTLPLNIVIQVVGRSVDISSTVEIIC